MTKQYFNNILSRLETNNVISEEQVSDVITYICYGGVFDILKNDSALLQSWNQALYKLCSSSNSLKNKYEEFREKYSLPKGGV